MRWGPEHGSAAGFAHGTQRPPREHRWSEITAASEEQSSGIEQVNQAIGQMDQVTQQNAALVEQAAAAAESMKEQAAGLVNAVAVFELERISRSARDMAVAPAEA